MGQKGQRVKRPKGWYSQKGRKGQIVKWGTASFEMMTDHSFPETPAEFELGLNPAKGFLMGPA